MYQYGHAVISVWVSLSWSRCGTYDDIMCDTYADDIMCDTYDDDRHIKVWRL